MSWGSKKVCRTWLLPGAARKISTRAASTITVLAVEMTVARRPPPDSSRGPRPAVPKPAPAPRRSARPAAAGFVRAVVSGAPPAFSGAFLVMAGLG